MPPKTPTSPTSTTTIRIYALGSNGSGQLSLPHLEDTSLPQLCHFHPASLAYISSSSSVGCPQPPVVKKLVAGGNHTLLLLSSGIVLLAGHLPGVSKGRNLFRVLLAKDGGGTPLRCRDVAATWEAVILVSEDGREVYVMGRGVKGELGIGEGVTETGEEMGMVQVPEGVEVVSVQAGVSHVVAVLKGESVWGWGTCRKGELGGQAAREGRKMLWLPRRVEEEDVGRGIRGIVCGKDSTVFTGEEGFGLSGSNRWIQDGDLSKLTDTSLERGRLYASWGSFYLHDEESGTITAVGRNDRGQLPPANLPKIAKMAAGSEHVVALTVEGEVVSWGWGEHGNCGPVPEGSGAAADVVAGRWNVIRLDLEPGWRVTDVGAGCATTFLIAQKFD